MTAWNPKEYRRSRSLPAKRAEVGCQDPSLCGQLHPGSLREKRDEYGWLLVCAKNHLTYGPTLGQGPRSIP